MNLILFLIPFFLMVIRVEGTTDELSTSDSSCFIESILLETHEALPLLFLDAQRFVPGCCLESEMSSEERLKVGRNEVEAILVYAKVTEALVALRFSSFSEHEKIDRVNEILLWKGWELVAEPYAVSLEWLTEYKHEIEKVDDAVSPILEKYNDFSSMQKMQSMKELLAIINDDRPSYSSISDRFQNWRYEQQTKQNPSLLALDDLVEEGDIFIEQRLYQTQ
ncbi:MAG: hypothetical protein Tsb0021_04350 [Chlamydiales bacterium]